MKKLAQVLILVFCISTLCGCESRNAKQEALNTIGKDDYTLKVEKKIYKYEKKALKREYKLEKLKAKIATYKALNKIVQDTNEIHIINTSTTHQTIEKK